MLVVTEPRLDVTPAGLSGKTRDALGLTWEERRWTRKRVVTAAGRPLGLALPTGTVLRPGDVIAAGEEWYVQVEARAEAVIAIAPRDAREGVRVAFDVGNRHFPLALAGDELLVPDDPAMEHLATRLALRWERRQDVFDPLERFPHAPGPGPRNGDRFHGRP